MATTRQPVSRRHTLTGAATVGLGMPLLAACGSDSETRSDPTTSPRATESPATPSPTATADAPSAPAADGLVSASEVPVGGGVILNDENVVITQPSAGEFLGFTATCTHRGCQVSSVDGGAINCACHGSAFSIEDGSVRSGPASSPLEEVQLDVQGDQISLA